MDPRPRDLVCDPAALLCQVARDLRPHPPHGGAATAYTSRSIRASSQSAHAAGAVVIRQVAAALQGRALTAGIGTRPRALGRGLSRVRGAVAGSRIPCLRDACWTVPRTCRGRLRLWHRMNPMPTGSRLRHPRGHRRRPRRHRAAGFGHQQQGPVRGRAQNPTLTSARFPISRLLGMGFIFAASGDPAIRRSGRT